MSHYFLDSSAVVKRYSPETGAVWVKALTNPEAGHTILLSELTLVEVAAAFSAKHRAPGGLTRQEFEGAVALFLQHCQIEYTLVAVARAIIDQAVQLTMRHRLRGYDAMQLATALITNNLLIAAALDPLLFVTADHDLALAAQIAGLTSDNPNLH